MATRREHDLLGYWTFLGRVDHGVDLAGGDLPIPALDHLIRMD